jgi:uncharacterized membrane protein
MSDDQHSVAGQLRRYFVTGLLILLPSVICMWLGWKMWSVARDTVGNPISRILGYGQIMAGVLGLAIIVVVILLVGLIATKTIGRKLISIGESIVARIPLISKVYTTIVQIRDAFTQGGGAVFKEVVLVQYPRRGVYSLGFVAGKTRGEIHDQLQGAGLCVFVPTTPNPTSGVLIFVPETEVIKLGMNTENAMKLLISAGMVVPKEPPAQEENDGGENAGK